MTPGYAKPRSELPWLPYEEQDRVIINSHNFTPATFDPTVNGKTPIGCWCPSKDTVGNGTTTLTDLVGSNNGTLTNMDAATDWVSDTGAGGSVALDFDGTNDYVSIPHISAYATLAAGSAFSMWFKANVVNAFQDLLSKPSFNNFEWRITNGARIQFLVSGSTSAFGSTPVVAGVWNHAVLSTDGSAVTGWINGSQDFTGAFTFTNSSSAFNLGRRLQFADFNLNGRIDDFRIWNQSLVLSDVTALYAAGIGRGKSA
jgi:hypothetical protein